MLWGCAGFLWLSAAVHAQTNNVSFATRAENIYAAEKKRFEAEPTNSTIAWQFARACFDWAEFATSDVNRAALAQEGITASRKATLREPVLAAGHYYLAMNLGQLARTKSLGALKLVSEMEQEFKLAAGLEPRLDYAGPDRSLGLLYFEAPAWPVSIGSRGKARAHLQRAVELSPDFPDNHLSLAEALLKWGDKKNLLREAAAFEQALPAVRVKFTGEDWAASWADWDKRWERVQGKAREFAEPPRKAR